MCEYEELNEANDTDKSLINTSDRYCVSHKLVLISSRKENLVKIKKLYIIFEKSEREREREREMCECDHFITHNSIN